MSIEISALGIVALPFFATFFVVVIFYFLYRFVAMNNTPFKAMKAIYVYLAALVGLGFVATGLYGLIEYLFSIMFLDAAFDAAYLITPLTRIIVGLFVMVPHWAIGHHFHLLEHGKKK
ncbi:MAG: hypothetical protein ABIH35_00350 [Patescibacteria group bacterium]